MATKTTQSGKIIEPMDNNKEEVIFTNEPRLLSKGDSRFTLDSQSPLWKALEGNNEAQNQLREMIEKIFPSLQSLVSEERKRIIDWCKKRMEQNEVEYGTDKWNGDMEDLVELLSGNKE